MSERRTEFLRGLTEAGGELPKEKTSSYESFIENLKLYGYPEAQARIQLDAAIAEAMSNVASNGASFEKVRHIVGNHSVMLHDLREKIVSLSDIQDGYTPVGAYEILDMLMDWARGTDGGSNG